MFHLGTHSIPTNLKAFASWWQCLWISTLLATICYPWYSGLICCNISGYTMGTKWNTGKTCTIPVKICSVGNTGKNAFSLMRRRAMSIRLFQLNLVPKFFICIGLLLIHRIIIILCIFDSVCLLSETSKISLIFPVCRASF